MAVKKTTCVIAGGGICGIFASILLADKFDTVYVIEKEESNGGLLKTVQSDDGTLFDQGTHIPNTTLIDEIDNILFGSPKDRDKNWYELGRLKSSNYFSGLWNHISQMVDVRTLPPELYKKGILELLNLTEQSKASDLEAFSNETLGETFTRHMVRPIVEKLYGKSHNLNELMVASSVSYFGLTRVIALNPKTSVLLKTDPVFDEKLAYHTDEDFVNRVNADATPQRVNYYPINGEGVGFWIKHLELQAKKKGVIFLNSEYVEKITYKNKVINEVILANSGHALKCDLLYWTAPPVIALKAANIAIPTRKLTFRSACIFHFKVDKPLLNQDDHYVWNWDVNFKGFRITLYPNMQQADINEYKVTIEVLCSPDEVDAISIESMYQELLDIEIISPDSEIISQLKQTIHHTFPIPTSEFNHAVSHNYELLSSAFQNIHIAGRYAGKSWFHEDVLKDVYYSVREMTNYKSEK